MHVGYPGLAESPKHLSKLKDIACRIDLPSDDCLQAFWKPLVWWIRAIEHNRIVSERLDDNTRGIIGDARVARSLGITLVIVSEIPCKTVRSAMASRQSDKPHADQPSCASKSYVHFAGDNEIDNALVRSPNACSLTRV
jgi:hypothetical protein